MMDRNRRIKRRNSTRNRKRRQWRNGRKGKIF